MSTGSGDELFRRLSFRVPPGRKSATGYGPPMLRFCQCPGVPSLCHRETAKVDRARDGAFRDMHHDVHRGLALDTAFIVVPVSLSIHRHERPPVSKPVFKSSMAICPSSSWV